MMLNNDKVAMRELIQNYFPGFGGLKIDFTVPVIDNFGDMGFALSLAVELLEREKDIEIRFFSENFELFLDMLGGVIPKNLEYMDLKDWSDSRHSSIRFNFFGMKILEEDLEGQKYPLRILNFDYLQFHRDGGTGNPGVGSLHGTSYMMGETEVIHIVPSLLPEGGGVVIPLTKEGTSRVEFLEFIGTSSSVVLPRKWCSVFVYPETLFSMKEVFKEYPNWVFFICGAVENIDEENVIVLPFLSLKTYENFLKLCDANIVRGENSLISAMLVGKPFLWDIYREKNGAHIEKMEDFGEYMETVIEGFGRVLREFMEMEKVGESLGWLLMEDTGGFERHVEFVNRRDLTNSVLGILEK